MRVPSTQLICNIRWKSAFPLDTCTCSQLEICHNQSFLPGKFKMVFHKKTGTSTYCTPVTNTLVKKHTCVHISESCRWLLRMHVHSLRFQFQFWLESTSDSRCAFDITMVTGVVNKSTPKPSINATKSKIKASNMLLVEWYIVHCVPVWISVP